MPAFSLCASPPPPGKTRRSRNELFPPAPVQTADGEQIWDGFLCYQSNWNTGYDLFSEKNAFEEKSFIIPINDLEEDVLGNKDQFDSP